MALLMLQFPSGSSVCNNQCTNSVYFVVGPSKFSFMLFLFETKWVLGSHPSSNPKREDQLPEPYMMGKILSGLVWIRIREKSQTAFSPKPKIPVAKNEENLLQVIFMI